MNKSTRGRMIACIKNSVDTATYLREKYVYLRMTIEEAEEINRCLELGNEFDADLKVGDTISASGAKDWLELRNTLKKEGYELELMPQMVFKIIGKKEDKDNDC